VVGIAEVAVDRVVLFEPAVHRSEVDGHEIRQRRPAVRAGRIGVRGDRSSGDPARDSDVPPCGTSLDRLGGTEQIRIEVVNGVVVLGEMTGLMQHDSASAIEHRYAAQDRSHSPWPRLPVADMVGGHAFSAPSATAGARACTLPVEL